MDEKVKNDIALFRYGVLAPLIQRQIDDAHPCAYFRHVQNKLFEYIDGSFRTVTAVTKDRWYAAYREKGVRRSQAAELVGCWFPPQVG